MKYRLLAVCLLTPLLIFVLAPGTASATNLSANISVATGCNGQVNGSISASIDVPTGSDVSLSVINTDDLVSQYVSGLNIPNNSLIGPRSESSTNNSATFHIGILDSATTITFTPMPRAYPDSRFTNNCPSFGYTPISSTLVINSVAPVQQPSVSSSSEQTSNSTTPPASSPSEASSTVSPKNDSDSSKVLNLNAADSSTLRPKRSQAVDWIIGSMIAVAVAIAAVASGRFFAHRKGLLWNKPARKKTKRQ